jgi:arylsulfatase
MPQAAGRSRVADPQGELAKENPHAMAQPNILLILADDMGYSDIGCYGSEIRTPNLDALAANGLRFSQMYNCARCCPSRASLLTGLYPHQAGIGDMVRNRGVPSYQGYLNGRCVTLGETLRAAGYCTALAGKWHVGGFWGRGIKDRDKFRFGDSERPLPTDRGFDRFYGNPAGGGSYFNVWPLIDQDRLTDVPEGFYGTDHYTTAAIGFMEEAVAAQRPFFVHLCYNAPHWPLHAWPEDIERYRGTYRQGWDPIRTARHERLKGMGLVDARWPISPRDAEAPAWCDEALQDWQDARMAAYAAQVDRMDQNIGRAVRRLEKLRVLADTLIVFVSDNGGSAEFLKENGRAESELPFTRDGRPVRVGNIPGLAPGGPETFMSYGLPWANASNTPFRRFKSWAHEGGIATPCVAHWPGTIQPGRIAHSVAHFVDVTATILDVAGARYPAEHRGLAVTPQEGESFAPLLRGKAWERTRPLFWEHEGNAAVRRDHWKLVRMHPGVWELYDMTRDRTELGDLAGRYPDVARELAACYEDWARRCGVLPWPLPAAR